MRGIGALALATLAHARTAAFGFDIDRASPREVINRTRIQAEGNKRDPYLYIASKGRNGAAFRAKLMAAKMPKPPTDMSLPFVSKARNDAFLAAAAAGEPRNRAMKVARRVPA